MKTERRSRGVFYHVQRESALLRAFATSRVLNDKKIALNSAERGKINGLGGIIHPKSSIWHVRLIF
jgi:hypothetical protein